MNIQHFFLRIIVAVLLVTLSYGYTTNENETNITTANNFNSTVTTLITTFSTQATEPTTTARGTSYQPSSTPAPTTISSGTNPTSSASATTANSSTASTASTSTKTTSPTSIAPGRKFDGISFIGGMILASGLGGIIFLIVSYLRRNNRLPYSNLR